MLIGLIADTHIPTYRRTLPPGVARHFAGVDLILHAGDLVTPLVLAELAQIANTLCVRGNNDFGLALPDTRVVEAGELAIGMVHIRPGRIDPVAYFGRHVDLVLYGHTHIPADETDSSGLRWVNPGSPTSLRRPPGEGAGRGFPFRRGEGTVGLLRVDGRRADVQILRLDAS